VAALDVDAVANAFLDVGVEALDTLPDVDPVLLGAPGKQFTCTGMPVIDCEQVAVWTSLGDIESGLRRDTNAAVQSINWVTFTIMVARCIPAAPKGKLSPSAEKLSENAKQTNADMWVVWCAVKQARKQGLLSDLCSTLDLGITTPLNPGGGYGGWQLPITVQMEGYKPLPVGS
jgi:hypothetical protein